MVIAICEVFSFWGGGGVEGNKKKKKISSMQTGEKSYIFSEMKMNTLHNDYEFTRAKSFSCQ